MCLDYLNKKKKSSDERYFEFKEKLLNILYPDMSIEFYDKKYDRKSDNIIFDFCTKVYKYEVIYNKNYSLYYLIGRLDRYGSVEQLLLLDKINTEKLKIGALGWVTYNDCIYLTLDELTKLFITSSDFELFFQDFYSNPDSINKFIKKINDDYIKLNILFDRINIYH